MATDTTRMKAPSWLPKIWPAAVSGLLVISTFPPFHLALLVFVSLVPWLLYLKGCDGRRAFRSGLLFGFIFWLGEFSFVAGFVGHWTHSLALGFVPFLLGCALGSLYFGLFGWIANICDRRGWTWVVPIVWAGVEVFRSYVFGLAFPFGLLAMPLTPMPAIIQSAHYGSVYFTSAWVMLANVILVELMAGRNFKQLRWEPIAFVVILLGSLLRYYSEPVGDWRVVVAGQTGADMAFGNPDVVQSEVDRAVDLIEERSKGADLLVLPEGIARVDHIPPRLPFKVSSDPPMVFGAQRGENPSYQSALSYDGHWEYADKTRLVIFGEYVPFRDILPFLNDFGVPGGDLTPGERITTLHAGKFKIGEALCFEALFPDVPYRHALLGANILAVMSIDDWYFGTNAPEQLRDATNWRAIETGLPAVRAASLGYSTVVDARGRTVAEGQLYGVQMVAARVRVPEKPDLFAGLPVFPYLSLISLLIVPAYDFYWRARRGTA